MKYNVIYADPPWSYKSNTGRDMQHGAAKKYHTMTNEEIARMPIKQISECNSVCFMWATVPLLPEAFMVMSEWGYKYKTMLTWRKIMSLGMGFWYRGQCEHLLLGIRGNVPAFRMQVPNFYQSKAGKHSQKPHYFRELIEKSTAKVFEQPQKLELFARDRNDLFPEYEYEGWDVFGNECKKSIILEI